TSQVHEVSLTADEVRNVARLARLGIDDAHIEGHAGELSSIVDVFARLQAVDTDAVAPMAHPLDLTARLRVDDVTEANQREALQAVAPAVEDGVYLVPKVIE